jgi:hypothetical protein
VIVLTKLKNSDFNYFSGHYSAFCQIGGKVYWRSTDPVPTWENYRDDIKPLPSNVLKNEFRTLVISKLYEEADKLIAEVEKKEKGDQALRDSINK